MAPKSVTEGHPDKIGDQISDAVPNSCLVLGVTKDNKVSTAGEITKQTKIDHEKVAPRPGPSIARSSGKVAPRPGPSIARSSGTLARPSAPSSGLRSLAKAGSDGDSGLHSLAPAGLDGAAQRHPGGASEESASTGLPHEVALAGPTTVGSSELCDLAAVLADSAESRLALQAAASACIAAEVCTSTDLALAGSGNVLPQDIRNLGLKVARCLVEVLS